MADFNEDAVGKDVLKAIAANFGHHTFADLTVVVGETEILCHKFVLCLHSAWFQRALTGGFKVGLSPLRILGDFTNVAQEATTSHITLEEDDPDVIKAMIEYCYRLNYNAPSANKEASLLFHARVFAAAEKYFVPTLEQRAASYFADDLEAFEPPALAFVEAAKLVYTITSDTKKMLRRLLVRAICEDSSVLSESSDNEALTLSLDSLPVFAADVARELASSQQSSRPIKKNADVCPRERGLNTKTIISPRRSISSSVMGAPSSRLYGCPCGCWKVLRATVAADDNGNLYRLDFNCASGSAPRLLTGRKWQAYAYSDAWLQG